MPDVLTRVASGLRKALVEQYANTISEDRLYTSGEVARMLGVSEASVKRWTDAGLLRTSRSPGRQRRMMLRDVAQFVVGNPDKVKVLWVRDALSEPPPPLNPSGTSQESQGPGTT